MAIGAFLSHFEPDDPRRATLLAFAALSGALLGSLLTLAQRRVLALPEQWARNALGWALAMLVTAIGAGFVPYGPLGMVGVGVHALSGLLAGAAAGAVTWGSVRSTQR